MGNGNHGDLGSETRRGSCRQRAGAGPAPAPGLGLDDYGKCSVSPRCCLGPTVSLFLVEQMDKVYMEMKMGCWNTRDLTVQRMPSSDSTEVPQSSCCPCWDPCGGVHCHGFPKRSSTETSMCLILFFRQLSFSVKQRDGWCGQVHE